MALSGPRYQQTGACKERKLARSKGCNRRRHLVCHSRKPCWSTLRLPYVAALSACSAALDVELIDAQRRRACPCSQRGAGQYSSARKQCHNAAGKVAPPAWCWPMQQPTRRQQARPRQMMLTCGICACACAGVFIVRPAGLDGQVAAAPQQSRVFGASRCQRRRAAAPAAKRSWGLEGVHATTREWQVRLMTAGQLASQGLQRPSAN